MARKSVGYVKLVWHCPNCGTRNPGPQKTCVSCGSPQPPDVAFVQADQQELITDEAEIKNAKKGADIHCPFCGARNPADTEICSQCGGDIKEGLRRKKGTVIGAYKAPSAEAKEIVCPHCGSKNIETAQTCTQCGGQLKTRADEQVSFVSSRQTPAKPKIKSLWIILGIILICTCILAVVIFILSTSSVKSGIGSVNSTQWERSIDIEELQDVERSDWEDELPTDATLIACDLEYHHSQDEPAFNATEVCGTEYIEDTGTGHGEVVKDCEYKVYQNKCDYIVKEYVIIGEVYEQGFDLNPVWPQPDLAYGQIEGERSEKYIIEFLVDNQTKEYITTDAQLFSQCNIGSQWTLNMNAFGDIVSIKP